ncbi:thiamine pyrophosphate-dependent enzyme, partial [Nocardioides sp. NPDC000441]
RAREGGGPTMIEAYTYRMGAHTTTDDPTRYRVSDEVEAWKLKDPIARVEAYLRRGGGASTSFFAKVEAEAEEFGERLRAGIHSLPEPDPVRLFDNVYTELPDELREQRDGYAAYLSSFEHEGASR